MKLEILPGVLVQTREALRERFTIAEGLATCMHVDCMDGHFVKNRTWYEAEPIETTLAVELHLMVSDPLATIRDWRRVPQLARAIWHVEIPVDHQAIIQECSELGIECGLAISPTTPVQQLAPYVEQIDEVLVLGVTPGWSGQELITSTIEKIPAIRRMNSALAIGFDGGVKADNIAKLSEAGADRVIVTSAIFEQADPRAALRDILSII